MSITTGKVKLMAASSCVPSWATKNVSVMLKKLMASMPKNIGHARRNSVFPIGACVRSMRAASRRSEGAFMA